MKTTKDLLDHIQKTLTRAGKGSVTELAEHLGSPVHVTRQAKSAKVAQTVRRIARGLDDLARIARYAGVKPGDLLDEARAREWIETEKEREARFSRERAIALVEGMERTAFEVLVPLMERMVMDAREVDRQAQTTKS